MNATERLKNEIQEDIRTDKARANAEERRLIALDRSLALMERNGWVGDADDLIGRAKIIETYLETGK